MPRSTLDTLQEFLEKTRRRLSDEDADYADQDEADPDPDADMYSDPDADSESPDFEDEDDEAGKFLREKLGQPQQQKPEPKTPEYSEYEPDEDEEAHQAEPTEPVSKPEPKQAPKRVMVPNATSDDLQPTREELAEMREYTRPWEQRARDKDKLEAQAHINPVKHHQGRLVEARNLSHAEREKAYNELVNSPEYQQASKVGRMKLETKFRKDWAANNPTHLVDALTAHHEAHQKGSQAQNAFKQAKDEKIRHIAGGGVQTGAFSTEEGLQHAGGGREEEDSAPSGISQDPSARFAAGNQEFLQQYMKDYEKRAKKYGQMSDMDSYDPETRADVESVLGDHPALKDPSKKRKMDKFVERYHPLIGKAARHVLAKLGLTEKANRGEIDPGLLHEAGMHALFQAVNDYDHDHPSKASFKTHLNRKMHGLMQTALKAQDEIPETLKAAAKKFEQNRRAVNASPVKHTNKQGVTTTIAPTPQPAKRSVAEIAAAHPPEIQDRLKRVAAAKAPLVRKQSTIAPKPAAPAVKRNVTHITEDEGGEE